MDDKVLITIMISATLIVLASGILAYGMINATPKAVIVTNNITNNTTGVNTTVEHINSDATTSDSSNNEPIEFNGRTHSENVADAKASRDKGGQCAGMTDEQIESMVSQEEAQGGRR